MPQSNYNPALSGNPQSATSPQYPNWNPDVRYNPTGAKNTDSAVPLDRTEEVVHNYNCEGPAHEDDLDDTITEVDSRGAGRPGTVEVIEPLHGRQRLRRQGCRGPSHELRQPLVLRHVLSGGARRA